MASPLIMKIMWLFLVPVASMAMDSKTVQRDFPQLANVIFSICGLSDIDISVSHPCNYNIFGMAYAFTECGAVHQADHENFQGCVIGCSSASRCGQACADPEVKNSNCLANCKQVKDCIWKAASTASGQVSANADLVECFSEVPPAPKPPAVIAVPLVVAAPSPAFAGSPAASPMVALAQTAVGPSPGPAWEVIPASPGPASAGVSVGSGPGVENFTPRMGTVSDHIKFVSEQCTCSKTGILQGVNTGQPGCAKHRRERNAAVEAYCYVQGGFECGGAMASDLFEGLHWVSCEKPNLHALFPPQCEILKRAEAKLFAVPPPLPLSVPPSSHEGVIGNAPVLPIEELHPIEQLNHDLAQWARPLPPVWHAQRENQFAGQPFQTAPVMPMAGIPDQIVMAAPAPAPAVVAMSPMSASLLTEGSSQLRGVRSH